ncbi:MAG: VanW family protein [Sporomusaceae bacterium]|nr:VanW family protein [Sporomusaceae bacterium]
MKKTWLVMTATTSVIIISLSMIFLMPPLTYPNVYKGVTVDGIDVSGRNREEVAQLLKAWQKKRNDQYITLYYGEMVFKLEAASIDFDLDINDTINAAWNYGRDGFWWERIKKIRDAEKNGYNIPLNTRYSEVKLNQLIKQWQGIIERPARNATLSLATGGLIAEQQGARLESDALRPLVLRALINEEDNAVALPVTTIYPEVTADHIASTGIREALSVYTTIFNSGDANRTANIKLSAQKTNGYIIYPGKVFSFNEIVGPREEVYGFKEALEIVDGEFVPGIGGGICQLSSTLYNAVILANLGIAERYNHSKPLSYVPLGRDATVAYGILDFKFTNNTPNPLMIMAEVNGNKLTVGIFGKSRIAETIEIASIKQEPVLPAIIQKPDDTLYMGETKIEKQGKPGPAVITVRIVRSQGREIKREVLSKDRYLPDDTIIRVGTQMPPFMREGLQDSQDKQPAKPVNPANDIKLKQ